ncbi:hypothetical protein [Streptomyces sp. NPDC007991]|uniref:hypothetical protein n=1 Tax=Streptomyces sp. NPDC007991 TaxID=3364803 RepID=UPI0036F13215
MTASGVLAALTRSTSDEAWIQRRMADAAADGDSSSRRALYAHGQLRSVLMGVWSASRSNRPVSRTGVVLAVLLAALVHVLACGHGPAPAGGGRADAILIVSTASSGPSSSAACDASPQAPDPAKDGRVHCFGLDEPTAQPSRDGTPVADSVHDRPTAEPVGTSPDDLRQWPQASPDLAPSSVHRERARLGVWRT